MGSEKTDLLVVGAGPAGLFAAVSAAEGGASVLLLEKMATPGAKLLLSGAGRCNLTHAGPIADFLAQYGDLQGRFLKTALYDFDNKALEAWFSARGLELVGDDQGKLFPATGRARDLLDTLLSETRRRAVRLVTGCRVQSARCDEAGFELRSESGRFVGDSLLLSTGGASYPGTGSTGDGYALAALFGHHVVPPQPALTPLLVDGPLPPSCAGISLQNVDISVHRGRARILKATGDLLFTHRGISGPLVLDASRSILAGDLVRVALLPGKDHMQIERELLDEISRHGRRNLSSTVQALGLPERLADAVLAWAGLDRAQTAATLDRSRRGRIVEALSALPLIVNRVAGFEEAMLTRGGVALAEVDPKTMMSRLVQGLYFAGEILDVDGATGGYNLQAAFSTGRLAGRSAISRLALSSVSPYYSS